MIRMSQGSHDEVTDNPHGTGCHDTPGCQICRIWHSDVSAIKTVIKFEELFYGLSAEWAFKEDKSGLRALV